MARSSTRPFKITAIAAAAALTAAHAIAQTSTTATQLNAVTVTGRTEPAATVGGWGDIPLVKTPLQASIYTSEQLRDSGAQRLSDLTKVDPAVSDAYNAEGYWDFLSVRGYTLDQRYNYRRDGLPINAETSIPLDNKARLEILKGTSGMQAGTSAPGGLANFVVKRPLDTPLRSAFIEWIQPGTVTGAIDLSQRFGADNAFGVRVNAAAAHLDPMVRSSKGERQLAAFAADWRASPTTLLEAEVEWSHRSQPSQPGFSMLGAVVPAPGDPRLSLNNQPWSLPVVFDATTASLRWQQQLGSDWTFVAHGATQRLRTDDRIAFPFGCSAEGNFDRYCSDGTYDLYDFRSEGERRRIDALDLSLRGKVKTGFVDHTIAFGALRTRTRDRIPPEAFNPVGIGNISGTLITAPDPTLSGDTTLRDENSTELYLRDAIAFDARWTAWLGVRHSRIDRGYTQSFTSPSVALSYAYVPDQMVYASWGRGVESAVAPNLPTYTNAGAVLPALKSKQVEIGLKGATEVFSWNLAWFDISRPQTADVGACDATLLPTPSCTTQFDGTDRHRGVEADIGWSGGPWTLRAGAQWLRARREGSIDAAINGLQPTNVPSRTLKAQAAYDVPAVPGLNLQATAKYESSRMVLPDNSASIPGYAVLDTAVRYALKTGAGTQWTWRAGIDNLFDKRAWRESPYQFGHVYLYPLAPRTFRLSMQVDL